MILAGVIADALKERFGEGLAREISAKIREDPDILKLQADPALVAGMLRFYGEEGKERLRDIFGCARSWIELHAILEKMGYAWKPCGNPIQGANVIRLFDGHSFKASEIGSCAMYPKLKEKFGEYESAFRSFPVPTPTLRDMIVDAWFALSFNNDIKTGRWACCLLYGGKSKTIFGKGKCGSIYATAFMAMASLPDFLNIKNSARMELRMMLPGIDDQEKLFYSSGRPWRDEIKKHFNMIPDEYPEKINIVPLPIDKSVKGLHLLKHVARQAEDLGIWPDVCPKCGMPVIEGECDCAGTKFSAPIKKGIPNMFMGHAIDKHNNLPFRADYSRKPETCQKCGKVLVPVLNEHFKKNGWHCPSCCHRI